MQTTLLGLAIAIILALVAALAGPFIVDWGSYRSVFEAEASRLAGVELRVTGAIEARLLPSPGVVLRGVEVGAAGASKLRARSLGVEFALGPLLRGEWRAVELRLSGAELNLDLDASGRLQWPSPLAGFDSDALSIERLHVEDARAVLSDASSHARAVLEKLWFNGELRSLLGPFKGEGAFTVDGELYPYRLTAGRVNEEGGLKLHLNVDPVDRPLTFEIDGALSFAGGEPRFEGAWTVARPVGIGAAGGTTRVTQPWRASSRVKASSASALLEQIEFRYGSEERGINLTGTAELKFGERPRFDGVLSARQIDLDRALDTPGAARQPPAAALRALIETAGGALHPPIPMQLGLGIDTVTLGGAGIQTLRGDISTDATGWNLDRFEFRAPGLTRVRLSGRLAVEADSVAFTGPADVESGDLKVLVAWLEGRPEQMQGGARPLRARGEVTLGGEKIAIERLKAEFDRETIEGRLSYGFAAGNRPPRLDAELNAPELDLDGALAFANAALAGSAIERPREMALAIDIGRATIAGFEARKASARLRVDAGGLQIERLSVADLGGAAIAISGRIETSLPAPRGSLNLELDARDLAGVTALLAKFAPPAAAPLRRLAPGATPAKLRATLSVEGAADGTATIAKLDLDGRVGALRVSLGAQASGEIAAPGAAEIRLEGKLEAGDGGALVALLGFDRLIAVDKKPGVLSLTASGPARGDLRVEGRLAAGGMAAGAQGTMRLSSEQGATGSLRVSVSNADARPLRRAGPSSAPLPVAFSGQLALTGHSVTLGDLSATIAGSNVRGKLGLTLAPPMRLDGEIEADSVNAAALLAAAAGMPAGGGAEGWIWSGEPFVAGVVSGLDGRIALKATRAAFTPELVARQLRATLFLRGAEIAAEDVAADLAAGRLNGRLSFRRSEQGLVARGRLLLSGVDVAAAVFPATARPPLSGKLAIEAEVEGSGLSPVALIGSLAGAGTITLEGAQFAGLDPRAFDAVTRAVDKGLPIAAGRIRDVVGRALDSGQFAARRTDAAITVTAGQLRLDNTVAHGDGADLALAGNLDLADGMLDARLVLSGSTATNLAASGRPNVYMALKGPMSAPTRTIDVSALAGWLTLRSIEQQSRRLQAIEGEPSAPRTERAPALPAPIDIRPLPVAKPPGVPADSTTRPQPETLVGPQN